VTTIDNIWGRRVELQRNRRKTTREEERTEKRKERKDDSSTCLFLEYLMLFNPLI
jgi:hypothetical protein